MSLYLTGFGTAVPQHSITQADAFFLTEEESEGIAAGETISVWRYD